MSKHRVTLLGGSGFIGSQLSFRLAQQFKEVVVLTSRAQRSREFRTLSNVIISEVNVHDQKALSDALQGSDVVINLIGILNEGSNKNTNSFHSAHVGITEKVLNASTQAGVRHYLHMSALNADAEKGSSEYLRTKGQAEAMVRATSGLNWTIFRPSVIFGEFDSFFNRFAGLLRVLPVFPLAVPNARMAPVFVGDVCDAMISAIDNPSATGACIELCGPHDYSLRELVEYTAQTAGLKRVIINLPNWASKLQGRAMELVPGKPFSHDNYLSLQTPSVCQGDCVRQTTSLDAVVPQYIGAAGKNGQRQKNRETAKR